MSTAIDERQRQEEGQEESLGWIDGQMVRTFVEEVVMQQGGCGMTRVGLGGWSLRIEVIESVAEIAAERNKSAVPSDVVPHSLLVVCRARQGEHSGAAGDATRMLERQMDHASQSRTVSKRVEEVSSAESSLWY